MTLTVGQKPATPPWRRGNLNRSSPHRSPPLPSPSTPKSLPAAPHLPLNSTLFPAPHTPLPPVPRRYAIRSTHTPSSTVAQSPCEVPSESSMHLPNSRRYIVTPGVLRTSGTEIRPPQTPVAAGQTRRAARSPSGSAAAGSAVSTGAPWPPLLALFEGAAQPRNAEFPASTPR